MHVLGVGVIGFGVDENGALESVIFVELHLTICAQYVIIQVIP